MSHYDTTVNASIVSHYDTTVNAGIVSHYDTTICNDLSLLEREREREKQLERPPGGERGSI